MKNEIIKGIKEEFKKINLFKIFLSYVLIFVSINILKYFNQYNYLSFLTGIIVFAIYEIIMDYKKNDIK